MKQFTKPTLIAAVLALALTAPVAGAAGHGEDLPQQVTVAFGAGLNTAQPGNVANHHILPRVIRIRQGGVVTFAVSGFHQIYVYLPGVKLGDVTDAADALPAGTLFINFNENLHYQGLSPAVPPPAEANLSNAMNRTESISFPRKGTYLVICNVLPHFRDGMTALVKVGDDKDRDGHGGHGEQ